MNPSPTIAYVFPTQNRAAEVERTLSVLGSLPPDEAHQSEVIVVENASAQPVRVPPVLGNGMRARVVTLDTNMGTAARNIGAAQTDAQWLVMLDDDSAPMPSADGTFASLVDFAHAVTADYGAIGGEIFLPDGRREAGGLPEVVIGCGCLVRRELFLELGGYDAAFDYYAEEYDLCARIIHAGFRVTHTRAVRFLHRKVTAGRSFGRIIHRLVRNNGWTLARHAPDAVREGAIAAMIDRYRAIADTEGVREAFDAGLAEFLASLAAQPRTPLDTDAWDRFTGAAAVRNTLLPRLERDGIDRVRLIELGKGSDTIRSVLHGNGIEVMHGIEGIDDARGSRRVPDVIGTLSPGPMTDALDRYTNAMAAWVWDEFGSRNPVG